MYLNHFSLIKINDDVYYFVSVACGFSKKKDTKNDILQNYQKRAYDTRYEWIWQDV